MEEHKTCIRCREIFNEYPDPCCYIFDCCLNDITYSYCLNCIYEYSNFRCKSCNIELNDPYNKIVIDRDLFCYCCFKNKV